MGFLPRLLGLGLILGLGLGLILGLLDLALDSLPCLLDTLSHLAHGLLGPTLCVLQLLRQPRAAEVVSQPREGGECGDSECAGCQKSGDGENDDESRREQNGAENEEERGGDGETDDGSGESEAGEEEEESAERKEGGESQNLRS